MLEGVPDAGPGADNFCEVYGNLFFHNAVESLIQAAGNVSIHDNLFVDGQYTAIDLVSFPAPLKRAYVYNNTIWSTQAGITFASPADLDDWVTGNLIFAGTPLQGPMAHEQDDLSAPFAQASQYVAAPVLMLPGLDLYPKPGKVTGSPLDLSRVSGDVGAFIDFNGTPKGDLTYRGAYAASGTNLGWSPSLTGIPIRDAGVHSADGGGADGGPIDDPAKVRQLTAGCGCDAPDAGPWLAIAMLSVVVRRRVSGGS